MKHVADTVCQRQVHAIQFSKQRSVSAVVPYERREVIYRSHTYLRLQRGQSLGIDIEHALSPRLALQGIARMYYTRIHQDDTPGRNVTDALPCHDRADRKGRVSVACVTEGAVILHIPDLDRGNSRVTPVVGHGLSDPSEHVFHSVDDRGARQACPQS